MCYTLAIINMRMSAVSFEVLMAAFTNFAENKIIDFLFRGQALGFTNSTAAAGSGPSNLYIALFTAITDGEAGTVTEVSTSGTGYGRVAVASALAGWYGTSTASAAAVSSGSDATTKNASAITFGSPTANWGTILGFGVYDAVTGGNLLIYGTLTTNKTVNSGDAAPSFAAAAFTFTLDN